MPDELSELEQETYSRQIVLADIGYDGQLKLRNGKACIVGIGGLGSPIALKLVGMGIGHLRMIDRDIVSRSDLHRQYLYDAHAVGQAKVEVALKKLNRLNPDVELEAIPESLSTLNAEELISGMDVVIDGLDRPEPRYLINRVCNQLQIPYIFGAAIEAFGNVSTIIPGKTFCLECFMAGLKDEDLPVCGVVGVHPSILGIVSSIQVSEAVRVLTGKEPKLLNKLLYIDLREFTFNILEIPSLESCRICGTNATGKPEQIVDRFFEETCARDGLRTFIISPRGRIEIDLKRLSQILKERGIRITNSGDFGLTFKSTEHITISMLKSGTMIAQAPPDAAMGAKNTIVDTYRFILVDAFGFSQDLIPDMV